MTRTRVDAGSDVAMLGAWDEARNANTLLDLPYKQYMATLASDAELGHLFMIQLGGDWGGPIDVFVDTDIPPTLRRRLQRVKRKFLISVPTGRLVVGGVEDYRSATPKITSESSVVTMPKGDYELHCYFAKDDEESAFIVPPDHEMEKAIGSKDYRYYKKTMRRSLYGYFLFLLFPAFAYYIGWKFALMLTILVVGTYYYVQEKILLRNARFQRVRTLEDQIVRRAQVQATPVFALKLCRLEERGRLRGGIIDFEEARRGL